ncbi:MAG: tape measure protein [Lachnospiraceae bacterium]|nr:tape measure protein [Lachnospiraceae bacterium]
MASIQTGTQLADNFSAPMMKIINSVNLAAAQMEVLGSTMNRSVDTRTLEGGHKGMNRTAQSMDVGGANAVYLKLSSIISSTEMDIRDNMAAQGTFNQEVERCHSPVSQVKTGLKGWQKAIIAANNGIELVKNTLSRLGVFDIGGAFDRIDTMNRFQKATSIMTGDTNVANAALEQLKNTTKGTAYGLDVASKATQGFMTRGMAIGNATDQVRIWADAVSFYGEGTNEQLSSVMDAIGKMYSKGTVEADQLDILYDAGIGAEEIYANAVGQSLSKVKGDLSQGKITSAQFIDTVSQALDKGASAGAAKDAGSTWETTFANVRESIISGWTNAIQRLDSALASHGLPSTMEMVAIFGETVEGVLNALSNHLDWIVGIAVIVGEILGNAGTFISENWGVIAPVLLGVAVAWGVYQVAALAASVAQWAMNTALLSCPITWVAIGLGALIALVLILANHFSGAGHIAQSAFGAICGVINVTNQFMDNLLKSALNIGLGIWEVMKACAYNLQTAFHNAICNVQCFFYDMLSAAIGVIESICAALNKLPFVEFDYSGISQAAEHFAARSAEVANSKRDYASIPEAFKKGASTFNVFEDGWIEKAYRNGALFGDFVTDKVKGYFGKNGADRDLGENFSTIPPTLTTGPLSSDVGKIADNTKKTADAVAITSEDLKYIRDLAETDYINRFTTASITVNQTNNNKINSSMDLDGVTEHLRATMEEQMISSAKGVH